MAHTTDRIRTTHVGSLPRPKELVRLLWDVQEGKPVDEGRRQQLAHDAVSAAVDRQRQVGIDVINDGEMNKIAFNEYIFERLSGFGGEAAPLIVDDLADFPEFGKRTLTSEDEGLGRATLLNCVAPVAHRDRAHVDAEIALLRGILPDVTPEGAFLNAVTPGQVSFNFPNQYYGSHEAYLEAVAEAMKVEYEAIAAAGFTLQLDSPDSALAAHTRSEGSDVGDFRAHLAMAVDALNYAVANIPAEQMRLHVCWGSYIGPHHKDVELREILPLILRSKPMTISFEAANPRHAHEWTVFNEIKLPDDKMIMPGVIDTKTPYIEHPDLVAQRIEAFVSVVGKERVIAGTDCGFSTYAGWTNFDPEIAWAKLGSLVEGARVASDHLF